MVYFNDLNKSTDAFTHESSRESAVDAPFSVTPRCQYKHKTSFLGRTHGHDTEMIINVYVIYIYIYPRFIPKDVLGSA